MNQNPEIAERIVTDYLAALRSGEYKQTTGRLKRQTRSGPCYCAEGLLAHIILSKPEYHKWYESCFATTATISEGRYDFDFDFIFTLHDDTENITLTLAGLSSAVLQALGAEFFNLIDWNDVEKLEFPAIADKIEQERS